VTETTLPATTQSTEEKRGIALLKAIGLDKVAPEQRELALAIADRYELDLMLKHLVLIEGRAFITRDGLLHVAHRSGFFDGIEVEAPTLVDGFWRATATVYRKDMTRGFRYPGRYPEAGKNRAYGPEMAIKVAESMALRRAFDVAAPSADEKWADDATASASEPVQAQSLADIARAKAEALREDGASAQQDDAAPVEAVVVEMDTASCHNVAGEGLMEGAVCDEPEGHKGAHKSADGSWPR